MTLGPKNSLSLLPSQCSSQEFTQQESRWSQGEAPTKPFVGGTGEDARACSSATNLRVLV